jgi:hypothetical protein
VRHRRRQQPCLFETRELLGIGPLAARGTTSNLLVLESKADRAVPMAPIACFQKIKSHGNFLATKLDGPRARKICPVQRRFGTHSGTIAAKRDAGFKPGKELTEKLAQGETTPTPEVAL